MSIDKMKNSTVQKNSIIATVVAIILAIIIFLWTSVAMPMQLTGLLLGMFINITIVDATVEYKEKVFSFSWITTGLQVISIVFSLVFIYNRYGFSWKWLIVTLITLIVVQFYLNFRKVKEIEQKSNIMMYGLFEGILSTLPLFFPDLTKNKVISFILGVIIIILTILGSRK